MNYINLHQATIKYSDRNQHLRKKYLFLYYLCSLLGAKLARYRFHPPQRVYRRPFRYCLPLLRNQTRKKYHNLESLCWIGVCSYIIYNI